MQWNAEQVETTQHQAEHLFGKPAGMCLFVSREKKQRGFTLVELITVIVILGILAVAAVPRFFDHSIFESRGFYDQVISALRYAQKTAIAQHRFVCVTIAGNAVTLTYDPTSISPAHNVAACTQPMVSLSGQATYSVTAPTGVTVSSVTFNFDALGRPNVSQQIITVSGNAGITVEAETGYVH